MQKKKFAIIGCGNIGKRHAAVIDSEEMAELVAVCDIDKERGQAISDVYNNIPNYTIYPDMLKNCDADIINICTPHYLHAEMAVEAAKMKKHILVEKPMALSSDDCANMLKAAKLNNVHLMVVKQNRYNIPSVLTKRAIDEGRLGRIFMTECNVFWNRHDGYYEDSPWRGKKEFEGGALFTQASHFIDLMIWFFGDVVRAKAFMDKKNHNIETEDCGNAIFEFDSGVMGNLLWTTCVYDKNYEGSITIVGEKGTIKIGGKYLNKIEYWDVHDYPLPEGVNFVDKPNIYDKYQGTSSNHDKVIKDVIAFLNNDKSAITKGEEGIKSVRAIEMIYGNIENA